MSFRDKIPGTFGEIDLTFAIHPLDAARAIDLLKTCYEANVSLSDLLVAVEDFLRSKGGGAQHIKNELQEVEQKFSGWLH